MIKAMINMGRASTIINTGDNQSRPNIIKAMMNIKRLMVHVKHQFEINIQASRR